MTQAIVGDVGGTKVELALATKKPGGIEISAKKVYPSGEYSDFLEIVEDYTAEIQADLCCLGVAGPILNESCNVTNLPWTVSARALESSRFQRALLLNDMEAQGHGLPWVNQGKLRTLRHGETRDGNRALIAAGTGLGESILFWDGRTHVPKASEGGHTGFGPATWEEYELLGHVMKTRERVSWERMVSGTFGFNYILSYFMDACPELVTEEHRFVLGDRLNSGPLMDRLARGGDPLARKVLTMFFELYGSEAGNLALKALAVGGVYIAGGIARKLDSWWDEPHFLRGFDRKGRFGELLETIPVHVVLDEDLALLGAAAAILVGPAF